MAKITVPQILLGGLALIAAGALYEIGAQIITRVLEGGVLSIIMNPLSTILIVAGMVVVAYAAFKQHGELTKAQLESQDDQAFTDKVQAPSSKIWAEALANAWVKRETLGKAIEELKKKRDKTTNEKVKATIQSDIDDLTRMQSIL